MRTQLIPRAQTSRKRLHGRSYPLQLVFSYLALKDGQVIQRGWGETIEIGSTRVRVAPIEALSLATTGIVMSIAWPAKFEDGASLQLVVQATPCGDDLGLGEFVILKHEFRIASKGALGLGLRTGFATGKAYGAHEPRHPSFPAQSSAASAAASGG
jgi:hypothetical protein